jgi:hypothetical protein
VAAVVAVAFNHQTLALAAVAALADLEPAPDYL